VVKYAGNDWKNHYKAVGVHSEGPDVGDLAREVPDNAVVVVDYTVVPLGFDDRVLQYGVALVKHEGLDIKGK